MVTSKSREAVRPHLGGAVRRSVLPSGLRLVTESIPHSHTLALGFFVGVGSRHESAGLHGAAHYLEHVLFKGTSTRSAKDISAAFDRIGGESNAYTAKEHTCFYAKVLSDDAEIACDVLIDMLTRSVVRPEDVESERHVILDEIAMHDDDPMEVAYALVAEHLYGSHALGRDVIGTRASIKAMSRDQVHSFWRRHYQPSDIVVSAAGDVDHDWLETTLAAAFTGEPVRRRQQKAPLPPVRPTVVTRTRETEQCSCLLALHGPEQFAPSRFAVDLLALVLGGGSSSRLFTEVRELRGLAYHIDASTQGYSDAGQFAVEWLCAPGLVGDITKLVVSQLLAVVRDGITEEELSRAKGQLRGQTLLSFETPETRMGRMGRAELTGDPRDMNAILDAYEAVTADEVREAARTLFAQPPVMAVVGAKIDKRPLDRIVSGWQESVLAAAEAPAP